VLEEGDSIDFTDLSTGDPTSWSWTFEGGEPASSTEQNPTVSYAVAGTYEVSLTVSNGDAEDTETKTGYIYR
jgi:PKD repeat protein